MGSRVKLPGCTVCSECTQIWLISLFCLAAVRFQPAVALKKKKRTGNGNDTAAGGSTRGSTGNRWASGSGVREEGATVMNPTCSGTWKDLVDHSLWGHWMQKYGPLADRNKYRKIHTPGGAHWTGSKTHCTLSSSSSPTHLALLILGQRG